MKALVDMGKNSRSCVGKNDEDQPDIPILTLKQAQVSLLIRTIVLTNMATCGMIMANIIKNW